MRMEERHTSSDGTVREYIVREKRWVVVQMPSENNIHSDEMLFLPSRQFNINFSAAEFKISGLPIPLVATGTLRSLEEQKDGDTGLTVWDDQFFLRKPWSLFSTTAKQNCFGIRIGSWSCGYISCCIRW